MLNVEELKAEIKKRGLTAYEISKHVPLSEDGINKILTGYSQNPRESTLLLLNSFLNGGNVKNVLHELSEQRKLKGISWNKLAEGLPVTGEGLRIAFARGKVQTEYIPIIEKNLNIRIKEKAAEEEVRLERIISKEVLEELKPYMSEVKEGQAKTHNDNKEIYNLVQKLVLKIEEIQSQLNHLSQ